MALLVVGNDEDRLVFHNGMVEIFPGGTLLKLMLKEGYPIRPTEFEGEYEVDLEHQQKIPKSPSGKIV